MSSFPRERVVDRGGSPARDAEGTAMRPAPVPAPHVVVLFGATGDLARRKLLPGLFHLEEVGLLPDHYRIIGTAPDDLGDAAFQDLARGALAEYARRDTDQGAREEFVRRLDYVSTEAGPDGLARAVGAAEESIGGAPRRLHYLSVPPRAASDVLRLLDDARLTERARVVMEKPFGMDLASARALNDRVHAVFGEEQIFRIDHFLGKEAAQGILALRFANGLFEPIWNRDHIDSIQIDVPETLSIGTRAAFYEATGAFRDMVVTHLFQVLAFVAMEPPTALEPAAIIEEKNKVFRSLSPLDPRAVVRGQYEGYRSEPGVAPDSQTETFVALRVEIDNWRWAGVPFFLRTGKRMAEGVRIVSIAFRAPPHGMFPTGSGVGEYGPDHLTFDLGDAPRLSLSFYGKRPGPGLRLDKASLQFAIEETGHEHDVLEAYERLIYDALVGDHTLFSTADGIERLWRVSAPLLEDPPRVRPYWAGSWGPDGVEELIAPRSWRLPFARRWREGAVRGGRRSTDAPPG